MSMIQICGLVEKEIESELSAIEQVEQLIVNQEPYIKSLFISSEGIHRDILKATEEIADNSFSREELDRINGLRAEAKTYTKTAKDMQDGIKAAKKDLARCQKRLYDLDNMWRVSYTHVIGKSPITMNGQMMPNLPRLNDVQQGGICRLIDRAKVQVPV